MAMEGPTPVSALIHAATMVTAGVYLLMRTSPLIEYSSTVLIVSLWLGAITTVFSSLIGLFQQDIKKVIAYSTMSQLGMMVIAIGLSSYNIALFHLVNHAFYKGLLFLGAGVIIHAVSDNQDFRKYGGLRPFLPLTYSIILIASLSLVAFPFMTGFYSKDLILESLYGQFYFSSTVIYFIATIGAMFTTLYSLKVLYLTFLSNPNGSISNYKGSFTIYPAHEGDIFMSLPLILLAVFSIFFGYISKDIFTGLGSGFFGDNSIFIHPIREILLNTEFAVPILFKLFPLIFTILLSAIAIIIWEYAPKVLINFKFSRIGYNIFSFFSQRFFIELLYNRFITDFVLKLGGQTTKVLDKGSIELLGPFGLEKGFLFLSRNISTLDTGVITSYALYILIGIIFYILIPYIYLFDNSLLILILLSLTIISNKKFRSDIRNLILRPLQSMFGGNLLFVLSLGITNKIILVTVFSAVTYNLGLLGFIGLIPNLFNNDLTVFMNHDISITSSATRYGLLELTNSLNRVISSIEHLLDSHSRLLATFDTHLINTASNMLHYPDGSIHIYRVREYLPNGTYTFVMNLSPEELSL
jgi:NADH-ubiquinone oxidoreductase chain 5